MAAKFQLYLLMAILGGTFVTSAPDGRFNNNGACPNFNGIEMDMSKIQFTGTWYMSHYNIPSRHIFTCFKSNWTIDRDGILNLIEEYKYNDTNQMHRFNYTMTPVPGVPGKYKPSPSFENGKEYEVYLIAGDPSSHLIFISCHGNKTHHEIIWDIESREKNLSDEKLSDALKILKQHGITSEPIRVSHSGCPS